MSANNKRLSRRRHKAVSGQAIIESIASILIFTIMLALIMSMTAYLYFQQALVTAAREGTRQASLNSDIGDVTSEGAGIDEVRSFVANEIQQLTGQSFDPSSATITVVPPSASASQTPGQRTVSVNINWQMTNPVNVAGLINALGGDGSAFATIPVTATATMRYEE